MRWKANLSTQKKGVRRNAYIGRQYHRRSGGNRYFVCSSIFFQDCAGHGKLFRLQQVSALVSDSRDFGIYLVRGRRHFGFGGMVRNLWTFHVSHVVFYRPCGQNSSSLVDRAEDADQNGHDRAGCIETFLR